MRLACRRSSDAVPSLLVHEFRSTISLPGSRSCRRRPITGEVGLSLRNGRPGQGEHARGQSEVRFGSHFGRSRLTTSICIFLAGGNRSVLPRLPRSGFILGSPGRVSGKREFSWIRLETFGNSRPKKFEHRSPETIGDEKSPCFAGPSPQRRKFSVARNAWLATQCRSHPFPQEFPANREFYREFCILGALRVDFVARNCCTAATFA
jgi:hypothetical protein